jgi:hypothetical protein
MRVITDILPAEYESIKALVERGAYLSVQQFVATAVSNQLHLESSASEPEGIAEKRVEIERPLSLEGLGLPAATPVTFETVPLKDAPLWGQYYRFLPLKVVLRVVANSTKLAPIELASVAWTVSSTARGFAKKLGGLASLLDVSPLPGFPATSGGQLKMAKSENRFLAQYLGTVGKDGRTRGFPFELGFLALENGSPARIALSPAGLKFVNLVNPLIDTEDTHALPLGAEESEMVLQHVAKFLPEELRQIRELFSKLARGPETPASLDAHFIGYYKNRFGSWSDAKCRTMRAGLTSRCIELGLVVNRDGRYALGSRHDELAKVVEGSP